MGNPYRLSPLGKADERYLDDPAFHAMVDTMMYVIETLQLTPGEVREAATYACVRIEERRTTPIHALAGKPFARASTAPAAAPNPAARPTGGA